MRTVAQWKRVTAVMGLCALMGVAWAGETIAPEPASGPPAITASYPADGNVDLPIGKLKVDGLGKLSFVGTRSGPRLIVKVLNSKGAAIGEAESTMGIGDTPVFVKSPKGLLKILVHWNT